MVIFLFHVCQGTPYTQMSRHTFGGRTKTLLSPMFEAMINLLYITFYHKISGTSLSDWIPGKVDLCREFIHNTQRIEYWCSRGTYMMRTGKLLIDNTFFIVLSWTPSVYSAFLVILPSLQRNLRVGEDRSFQMSSTVSTVGTSEDTGSKHRLFTCHLILSSRHTLPNYAKMTMVSKI